MWLFNRKKNRPEPKPPIDPVVEELKQRTHAATEAARHGADRLNSEFTENHITLTILRTMGGSKSGR